MNSTCKNLSILKGEKWSWRVSDKLEGKAVKLRKEGPHEGLKVRSMKQVIAVIHIN